MSRSAPHRALRSRILATAGVLAVAMFGLTGCATAVALTPAPQSTAVACAGIIASLSQVPTIDKQALRQTDAQGTAAWGAEPAITLRCGVQTGVSADPCITVDTVDWQYTTKKNFDVITTYGRSPATQVVLDERTTSDGNVLPTISDAISNETTATKRCQTDPTATPSPSPSPSPSVTG